jgi:uncharacterized membrane protein
MSQDPDWRLLIPRFAREFPADLAVIIAVAFATTLAATLPGLRETPLRIVLGLPYVLFVPGYALIAALFPESRERLSENRTEEELEDDERGIDGIERVALSFGLSIAVVPLIGLVLNFTPWGIRLLPILISVTGVTVVLAAVAAHRRAQLEESERFRVPYRTWAAGARNELFEPESRTDAALNVLLVVSILLAVGSVGYAVAVPGQGEQFTELYLLTEDESGELVANNYPTEFTTGETKTLYVGIGNHEGEAVQYTVVSQLQRVEVRNNTTLVRDRRELSRYSPTVPANSTWRTQDSVTPTMTGDRLRLTYLLYKDSPPSTPTVNNSYREVHLWVNVTAEE